MVTLTLSDLATFINHQIKEHEHLAEQLTHLQHLIDFTASSDLKNPDPLHLNAQLIAIEKGIKEVQDLNQHLQASLINYQPQEDLA